MSIYFLRHGHRLDFEIENYVETCNDGFPFDPPLSKTGLTQASEAGRHLAASSTANVKLVVCSPYYRCVQTAHTVATHLNVPVQLFSGCGEWLTSNAVRHGAQSEMHRTREQLSAEFPRLQQSAQPGHPLRGEIANKQKESKADLIARGEKAFQELHKLSIELNGAIVCVSHAATLLALQHFPLGGEIDDVRTGVCSLTHFEHTEDGKWIRKIKSSTDFLSTGELFHWHFNNA